MIETRKATIQDLKSITSIYNWAIVNTVATFDTEEKTIDDMKKWFLDHGSEYPIVVAEIENKIVGFASLSKYSTRCAYSNTAELSVYVGEEFQGQGTGKNLMKMVLEEGKKAGLHAVITRITDNNKRSIHLHEVFGFVHVGVLKEVGKKFDRVLDVLLMEKLLK